MKTIKEILIHKMNRKVDKRNFVFRNVVVFILLIATVTSVKAESIRASTFGYNKADATACLYAAFYSANDTIIIDNVGTAWKIGPIVLKEIANKTIIFEKGVVIKALEGRYQHRKSVMFDLKNINNLSIYGNGAKLHMNKSEYVDGEWRHGISIRGCKNITIKRLEICDSGGDGIYISGLKKGGYSEDIRLENIISDNNKRQGLSIISAQNVYVKNSIFKNTKGTLPGAGLDIEPNTAHDRIVNVNFENCIFRENDHSGIMISLQNLNSNSTPVSVNFYNCYLSQNHNEGNPYAPAEITIGANKESPVKGKVQFENCLIENSDWGFLYSRKRSDAFHVTFSSCAAINISKKGYCPIYFEVPDYNIDFGPLGGFTFEKMYINYDVEKPFVRFRGSSRGTLSTVKNITGDFVLRGSKVKGVDYIKYNPEKNENVEFNYVIDSD